jgi:hypothetical protein
MLFAVLALAVSLAAADPSPSGGAAPPAGSAQAPPAKPDPKKDPKRVVCEESAEIGSIVPKRVCRTQAEWDRRAEHDRATVGTMQGDHANN